MRGIIIKEGNITYFGVADFNDLMKQVYDYVDERANPNSIILGSSNPILPPSEIVIKQAAEALRSSNDIYTYTSQPHQREGNTMRYYSSRSGRGIEPLRQSLQKYIKAQGFKTKGLDFWFANSIQASLLPGICEEKLLKTGSTVLMTMPTYGPFFSLFKRKNMDILLVKLDETTNWKLTPSMLEEILKREPNIRLLPIINPGNPIGELYDKEELQALSAVIIRHNNKREAEGKEPILVFADEVARNAVLCKKRFTSIGSIAGMEEYTFTAWSLSKDQAPGLAMAMLIGPAHLIEKVRSDDSGPSFAIQEAAAQIFNLNNQQELEGNFKKSVEIYRKNFDVLKTKLIPQLNDFLNKHFQLEGENKKEFLKILHEPEGAFQVVLNADDLKGIKFPQDYVEKYKLENSIITSSLDLALFIKRFGNVEFIPGEGFGFTGDEMMLRMTLSKSLSRISEAFFNVRKAFQHLQIETEQKLPPEKEDKELFSPDKQRESNLLDNIQYGISDIQALSTKLLEIAAKGGKQSKVDAAKSVADALRSLIINIEAAAEESEAASLVSKIPASNPLPKEVLQNQGNFPNEPSKSN